MAKRTLKNTAKRLSLLSSAHSSWPRWPISRLSKACQIIAGLELGRRFYANNSGKPIHVAIANSLLHLKQMGLSQKEQMVEPRMLRHAAEWSVDGHIRWVRTSNDRATATRTLKPAEKRVARVRIDLDVWYPNGYDRRDIAAAV